MRFLRMSLVVSLVAAVLLAACGGSSNDVGGETDAQPQTQDSTFVSGEFAGLPLPSVAQPFGSLTTTDEVTTQTFQIKGYTPEQVMEFYDGALTDDGWTTVQAPEQRNEIYVGTWTDDAGRRLEVSSSPAQQGNAEPATQNGTNTTMSQFSLVLHAT